MNGITRVVISVFLLGVCAVAMRFTMQSMPSGEFKRQLLTARLDTKKLKKLMLKFRLIK
jgi:major membrane immunogen (membrane-anchored lipoprotein)